MVTHARETIISVWKKRNQAAATAINTTVRHTVKYDDIIKERVDRLRSLVKGYYLSDFAKCWGLNYSRLNDMVNGRLVVSEKTALAIAEKAGVDPLWLLYGIKLPEDAQ